MNMNLLSYVAADLTSVFSGIVNLLERFTRKVYAAGASARAELKVTERTAAN